MTIVKAKTKLRKSASAKKRYGEHHRTSRNYLKTYWPYLPMLGILVCAFILSSLLTSHPSVLGISSNLSNQSFLSDTNYQRGLYKEAPLTINTDLTAAAQNKADDMVKLNFWSHISPSGETPWQYIAAAGYSYQQAGENLAYGFSNAADVVNAWMNSPEHRQNILNADYQNVGFAVASSSNFIGQGPETVVVAEYAEPSTASTVTTIAFNVNSPSAIKGASAVRQNIDPSASLVSRIQVLTGGSASWSLLVAAFLTGVIVCYFIVRNIRRIKRIAKDGERFAAHHIALDILLVVIISAGYILTRTSGVIH